MARHRWYPKVFPTGKKIKTFHNSKYFLIQWAQPAAANNQEGIQKEKGKERAVMGRAKRGLVVGRCLTVSRQLVAKCPLAK